MISHENKYPAETAARKLIDEFRFSLRKITKFFFEIPNKKMDKYIYVMETLAWILLTGVLIMRIIRL